MTINFIEFPVFQNFEKTETAFWDIRKSLSDLLYKRGDGILAHTLCHTIYESAGPVEIDNGQVEYLIKFAEGNCTPAIIDSLKQILSNNN